MDDKRNARFPHRVTRLVAAGSLLLAGCTALTTNQLVNDAGHPRTVAAVSAAPSAHCSGNEWMDNSMIAVFPIPILAFASPTQEINEIEADQVLRRCGPPERLVNRRVDVSRGWCVPTVLTRLITLGIWHWCPANVSWDADVAAPAVSAEAAPAPAPAPRSEVEQSYRHQTRIESSEY